MTDTNELRSLIVKNGYTQTSIAEKIGISYKSFSYKLNNKVEFKVSEIEALCSILGITDKDKYFFCS